MEADSKEGIIGSAAMRLLLAKHWQGNRMAKVAKIQWQFFSLTVLLGQDFGRVKSSHFSLV